MLALVINLALILGLIVVGELVARLTPVPPAIMRKAMHVATGTVVIVGSTLTNYHVYVVIGILMVGGLLLLRKIIPLQSVHDRYQQSQGEVYFALGAALAALISPSLVSFIAAITILSLGDTAAYVVGRAVPSPLLRPTKSIAGSSACFIISLLVLLALNYNWGVAVLVSIYVTAAEILSTRGTDNATIPGIAAVILAICSLLNF